MVFVDTANESPATELSYADYMHYQRLAADPDVETVTYRRMFSLNVTLFEILLYPRAYSKNKDPNRSSGQFM